MLDLGDEDSSSDGATAESVSMPSVICIPARTRCAATWGFPKIRGPNVDAKW